MIDPGELLAFPALFCRVLGILIVLPFSQNLSNFGKLVGVSTVITLFFLPFVSTREEFSILDLGIEAMVGILIGLPCAMVVEAVRSLGELFDSQRGASFASLYDPTMNQNASFTSILTSNYCIVILIQAGIAEAILFALKESLIVFPVMSVTVDQLLANSLEVVGFISLLIAGAFKAFLICAIIFMLVDLGSVFVSKVLPQGSLNQEIFMVKTVMGLLVLIVLLGFDWGASLSLLATPNLDLINPGP